MPPPGGQKSAGSIRGAGRGAVSHAGGGAVPRAVDERREDALKVACPAAEQVGDGPGGDQPAPVDDDAVVGHVLDLAEQVAGQEDRAAVVGEPPQEGAQRGDPLRVQPVERLVQHQHARVPDQRGRQRQALPHAERVPAHPASRRLGQAELGQQLLGPPVRHPRLERGDAQVLARAPVGVEALVEDRAHDPGRVVELAVGVPADGRRPRRGRGQPQQGAHAGRLPGAVGPEEDRHPAGQDAGGQPVHRGDRAVPLGQLVEGEGNHGPLLSACRSRTAAGRA